jgi:iron(III) transport system ATP-binding protein
MASVRLGGVEMELPQRGTGQGAVKLAVKPDAILVHTADPGGPSMPGKIVRAAYLGRHIEYWLSSPLGELFVVDRGRREPLKPGTEIWTSFSNRDITIVRLDATRKGSPGH